MTGLYGIENAADLDHVENVLQQARRDRLQCGWTTQMFLEERGALEPNVYLWRVVGRYTLVEKVWDHPTIPGMVIYRELADRVHAATEETRRPAEANVEQIKAVLAA